MEKIKGNVIHICFSPSAGGSLKHAVKTEKLKYYLKINLKQFHIGEMWRMNCRKKGTL